MDTALEPRGRTPRPSLCKGRDLGYVPKIYIDGIFGWRSGDRIIGYRAGSGSWRPFQQWTWLLRKIYRAERRTELFRRLALFRPPRLFRRWQLLRRTQLCGAARILRPRLCRSPSICTALVSRILWRKRVSVRRSLRIRLRSVLLRSGLCRSAIHLRAGSGGCTAGVHRRFIRPEWKLGAGSKLLCGPAAVSAAAAAELSPARSAAAAEL